MSKIKIFFQTVSIDDFLDESSQCKKLINTQLNYAVGLAENQLRTHWNIKPRFPMQLVDLNSKLGRLAHLIVTQVNVEIGKIIPMDLYMKFHERRVRTVLFQVEVMYERIQD